MKYLSSLAVWLLTMGLIVTTGYYVFRMGVRILLGLWGR